MRLAILCWSLLLVIGTSAAVSRTASVPPDVSVESSVTPIDSALSTRGVAYFEPPKSVGTPIAELARVYEGVGLANRIAGRLRLDTDPSLAPATREQIRRHLAHRN